MQTTLKSVDDAIDRLGGNTAEATALKLRGQSTVSEWRRLGSIPAKYWHALAIVASAQGLGFDERDLAFVHRAQKYRRNVGRKAVARRKK
jgi:hypothetical protein